MNGGSHPRHNEYLREPLVRRQGSQVSMRAARGSESWLSSHVHWRRKWQPTPVFLPGESQGRGSLVGCCLWDRTESDTTEVTYLLAGGFGSLHSPGP